MKKILLLLLCMILLIGNVSAFEFDNVKSYDEETRTVEIRNSILGIPFFKLDKVADIQLTTPLNYLVPRGYQKVAEFEVTSYGNYNDALKELELYDKNKGDNKFTRDYDFKYLTYEYISVNDYESFKVGQYPNGTAIYESKIVGTHTKSKEVWNKLTPADFKKNDVLTIGIFTNVQKGDKVEWIPNFFGVRINEWAVWEEYLYVGLVAYWQLDETSGSVAEDIHGDNNGTYQGNLPTNVTGICGNAQRFDGSSDFINETGDAPFDWGDGDNYTLMTWYKNGTMTAGDNFFHKYSPAKGYYLSIKNASGNMDFTSWNGTTAYSLVSKGAVTWDDWNLITAVRNGTSMSIYINGVLDNTAVQGEGDTTSTADLHIGRASHIAGSYIDGDMDNSMVYNRSVNGTEVSDHWNGGSCLDYPPPPVGPIITLNTPIEAFNSTSQTINFNGTVSSPLPLVNVSLIIDGAYNETNSSGINATDYLFTKIISEGDHNWTYEACDNLNSCANATVRTFSIDTAPVINVFSPPLSPNNTNYTTSQIYFNATASQSINNWIVNYNGTNITLPSINSSLIVEDGNNFHLLLYADNSVTGVFGLNDSIYFSVDANNPLLNVTAPFGDLPFGILTTNESLLWNVSDVNLDSCFYNYDFTNVTTNCATNTTTFTLTNQRNLTFYANDTFGNIISDLVTWDYFVFENSQEFNNETLEGTTETFTANITTKESVTITVASLIYNGTSHIGSLSEVGNDSILTRTLTTPNINTEINLTFFWSLLLSDSQIINLTAYNQTVSPITLDNCSVNSIVLYNYTIVHEENQSQLTNTTAELNINLLDEGREDYFFNFSIKYSDVNPFGICINENLSSTTYLIDSIVKYEAINFSIEYYNIVNATISNSTIPNNITLYDLLIADTTEFKITFKDEDFTFVENALVYIDRQYIAENNTFKTVELPKTDSNGQTIGHFVRNDVVYNIRIIKNGVVLGNFQNIIAFCEDYTIGNCQMVLEATPEDLDIFDYDEQLGIIFQTLPTYNENTSAISFSYSTDDGSIKTVLMEVTRDDIFGNRSICNNTIVSSSGTLSCSFDPSIDDAVLRTEIFVDNQTVILSNVKLESSDYGNLGFILWFFLTLIFILLFGNSKTEVLIGLGVSFIGAIVLGISRGDIIGLGSAGIWILVVIILGIWKLNKENPQT